MVATVALMAGPAEAKKAPKSWPPVKGKGLLFAHFGEEHWNDDDSDITLPAVVADAARYKPDLVTMSGDKDNDGTVDQLTRWKQIMSTFDQAGVPYLPGVGNHDRTSPPGTPAGTAGLIVPGVQGSLTNYKNVFADRPYPFGDAAPYPGIGPSRPGGDPDGASSHYFADIGSVRWIFIDNSCWGIADCDSVQNPSFPDAEGIDGQFDFLERKAREASDAGRTVFVVMHIPTRDPRDQSQIETTSFNHVMGKGLNPSQAPDNARFEDVADRSGVDGVFVGHIKGQWLYKGQGGVPYYIDGGAGGELYTNRPLGTDSGYWHGFRLVRVRGTDITTDVVPIFKAGSITVKGPDVLRRGQVSRFEATGIQAKQIGRRIELDLRDPDPIPRTRTGTLGQLGAFLTGDGLILVPPAAMLIVLLLGSIRPARRRLAVLGPAAAAVALGGLGAVALAEQSIPTDTPKSSLPNPARIWTSSDRFALAPVSSSTDDPRRNRKIQTQDGAFRGKCPGRAKLTVTSGFEKGSKRVRVPSRRGKIVRSIAINGPRARVRLRQRAEVFARVKRGRRVVRQLGHRCFGAGKVRFRWNRRIKRGRLVQAPQGRYRLQVVVLSDRRPVRRSGVVRVG
ncbi:MAG: metallophosphoesterase [Actinomycetota bacterium]